jgi:superfamily II DNA or RNA helicase
MAEASERLDKPVIYGDAVKHYQRICPGVPAIAFCPSVHNAEVLADYFENSGIPAASIDGKMSDAQRKHRIEGLGNGRYLVLTNCALVEEGTDIPIVGAAILQRPTESMGLAIQQMGRCLRPYPGKTQSYILDMVGNCGGVINGAFVAKHGLPDDDREWSLDGAVVKPKGEASEPTLVRCMKCFHLFPRYMKACDLCGTPKEVSEHEIQQVEGDLQVITPESIRLDYLRREEAKRNAKELIRRARTLPELQECARILGYKSSWAYFIFKSRMGKVAV